MFACLEKKDSFTESLVNWISSKVLNVPNLKNEFPVDGLPVGKTSSFQASSGQSYTKKGAILLVLAVTASALINQLCSKTFVARQLIVNKSSKVWGQYYKT